MKWIAWEGDGELGDAEDFDEIDAPGEAAAAEQFARDLHDLDDDGQTETVTVSVASADRPHRNAARFEVTLTAREVTYIDVDAEVARRPGVAEAYAAREARR